MTATSVELRNSNTQPGEHGNDILLSRAVTTANLKAELAKYPDAEPGKVAYNGIHYFNPSAVGAIHAILEPDGKWYTRNGEVT